MNFRHVFFTSCATLTLSLTASSAVIFDNADAPLYVTNRNSSIEGVASYLQIGASNVTVSQVAINAQPFASGQLKFVIFSDVAAPGGASGTLLFSDTTTVSASASLSYLISDPFSFTLQAGHYYDIGTIFSGTDISYTYDFTSDTENGITSLVGAQNINDFSNPVQVGHGGVSDISIRLYSSTAVTPEPASFLLGGLGLVGAGIVRTGKKPRKS